MVLTGIFQIKPGPAAGLSSHRQYEGNIMTKYLLAAAAVAAIGFASAAYAGDATAPKPMSDSEMDSVTAGQPAGPFLNIHGVGNEGIGIAILGGKNEQGAPHSLPSQGFQGKAPENQNATCASCVPSDLRLKRDIIQVARLDNGLALYRYRYKSSDQVYVGVMAQEVLLVRPDAVVRGADGYLRVNYGQLGIHLMTWDEWIASGGAKGFRQGKNAPSGPAAMSDAEMDKVTAGSVIPQLGIRTAETALGRLIPGNPVVPGTTIPGNPVKIIRPGLGINTVGTSD
jgi:hypothetical protein